MPDLIYLSKSKQEKVGNFFSYILNLYSCLTHQTHELTFQHLFSQGHDELLQLVWHMISSRIAEARSAREC